MGLKCGHSPVNYSINHLSFETIINLIKRRKDDCTSTGSIIRDKPVIDVDASWVVRRFQNMSYDMRVFSLIKICLLFTASGCCVNIVCDGEKRHHSKRSTTKRSVDCY